MSHPARSSLVLGNHLNVGNMAGVAKVSQLLDLCKNSTTSARCERYRPGGKWAIRDDVFVTYNDQVSLRGRLTVGFGSQVSKFGPEMGFGFVVGDFFAEKVLLIKAAVGGTSLATDWRPPSSGPSPNLFEKCDALTGICQPWDYGVTYRLMLDVVNAMTSDKDALMSLVPGYNASEGYTISGFVWFQGFNDVINPLKLDEYSFNLKNLIRDVRTDLNVSKLPFIIGELGMEGTNTTKQTHLRMRRIQKSVATSPEFRDFCTFVPTAKYMDGLVWKPGDDGVFHYLGRPEAIIPIGEAFGNAVIKYIPTVAPTSPATIPTAAPTPIELNRSSAPFPLLRPTLAPTPSGICFSGNMQVTTRHKGIIKMSKLQMGDEILVDESGVFEPVYSFGHRSPSSFGDFVQIRTNQNVFAPLELSETHMLSVGRHYIPASSIKVGDILETVDGKEARVILIQKVVRKGLYAPFTPSGTLVVNGLKASSFVAFQDSDVLKIGNYRTPFSFQCLEQTFEFPHRMVCYYFGACASEQYTSTGISLWVYRPLLWTQWWLGQNSTTMLFAFLGLLPFLLCFASAEILLQHTTIVAMLLIVIYWLGRQLSNDRLRRISKLSS
jgi:hypothetical protein